jgi:hypothetical protein
MSSVPKEYCNRVLLPLCKEMTFSILQVLAREALGRTGTIQGKVAIGIACQPVKSGPVVEFLAQGVRHNSEGKHGEACS